MNECIDSTMGRIHVCLLCCLQVTIRGLVGSFRYDFYTHVVYVVMCYMSITCTCLLYVVIYYMSVKCYVSVMCLVLTVYIIYAHLCNHHTRYKVVVGLWTQFCAQLEVWVLGVGMSTLGTQTVCTPRIGGSKYRWPWSMYSIEWGTSSYTVQ